MKRLILILFLSNIYSQDIIGSWMLKEHYSSGMLTISSPYLKYKFIEPNILQISVKQDEMQKGYNYYEAAYFKVSGDSLKLTFDNEVLNATYSIQGDSLFTMNVGQATLVFRRKEN